MKSPFLFDTSDISIPDQRVTVGKRVDGRYFIDIQGRHSACAYLTPQGAFDIAKGIFKALGYHLELGDGPQA